MLAQMKKMKNKFEKFDAKFDILLRADGRICTATVTSRLFIVFFRSMPTHDILSFPHKNCYPELAEEHVNMRVTFRGLGITLMQIITIQDGRTILISSRLTTNRPYDSSNYIIKVLK